MGREEYRRIVEWSLTPQAREASIRYLAEHLGKFLRKRERVLICFLEHKDGNLSWLMEQAALRCEAVPVIWGPDHRWKTLLQQAYYSHASAVIGPPLVLLGLTKLKKYHGIPLPVRRVVSAGYLCMDWMVEGIAQGLDCQVGGCFSLGESGAVAGFACGRSWGVHLRDDVYGVDTVDREGHALPTGEPGELVLYPVEAPELRCPMGDTGRVLTEPCACGSTTPRIVDFAPGGRVDTDLAKLGQYLHSWTSILDCRLTRGESGLEIEIVCFPGEKLPRLPEAAKLVIRPWNPKNDEPFFYQPVIGSLLT